jgi:Fur family transcriptional regulator, peroxide stress response regulator
MRRTTKQREAIMNFLVNNRTHPTADVIYESVKKEIPNISIATIYRNLRVLKENGQVAEVSIKGDLGRFEAKQGNHYHFYCEKCGKVMDIDEPVDEKLNERVTGSTGLKISSHQIEFHGLCKDCQ